MIIPKDFIAKITRMKNIDPIIVFDMATSKDIRTFC